MIDLGGRIALVTGAGSGIGLAIASILTSVGARVAVNDIDSDAAVKTAGEIGGGAFAVSGNVADEAQVEAMLSRTVGTVGQIDVLVNNASIAEKITSIRSQQVDDWQRVIDVNLRGTYLMSRAAARVMIPQRSGVIINVASIAGLTSFPSSHAYGVSKAAVVMMTKTLATELARHAIRVNAVAPGVIDAPMLEQMSGTGDRLPKTVARVPLGRLGTSADVGRAVAFLASDAASYITGAVLPVDGGWLAFGGAGNAWSPAPQQQGATPHAAD